MIYFLLLEDNEFAIIHGSNVRPNGQIEGKSQRRACICTRQQIRQTLTAGTLSAC